MRGTPTRRRPSTGTDADAQAFTNFIVRFLSTHGRWNSPKYLFGESYGTLRAALVAYNLENAKDVDLNGVILLSQILAYDKASDFRRTIRASMSRMC